MEEFLKATGKLDIILKDSDGNIKQELHVPNLVVKVGKNFIASRMVGTSSPAMSHMAIGTNTTAPESANTSLGKEIARVALDSATATANTVSYSATFPAGTGSGAITEAGIFNAASSGTLLCRTTFAVVNKSDSDSLTIKWNVTIS